MKQIGFKLLKWYKKVNYDMPWRTNNNPYNIWISEIMLQQTQVNTVKKYFINWMKTFPSIEDVATSTNDQILKNWQGLGYYSRAHNIHKTAKYLVKYNNGEIPNSYDKLINLKGIGEYTAAAILSISYNKPYPAIDGNLKRIFSRLFMLNNHQIENKIKNEVLKYFKDNNPGDINQALMDLGRTICKSKNPLCLQCPIKNICQSYKLNIVSQYPKKNEIKSKPLFDVVVGVIKKEDKFIISKRKLTGLLAGLWELPGGKKHHIESNEECLKREVKEELGISIRVIEKFGKIQHHYSHFKINLIGYYCIHKHGIAQPISSDKIKWITYKEIDKYAFPQSTIKLFSLMKGKA